MSTGWEQYVQALLKSKQVSQVAIFGHDGTVWAHSPEFLPKPEEIRALIYALDNDVAAAMLPMNGINIASKHYHYVKHERGKNMFAKKGDHGMYLTKTTMTVIVALYDPPISPTACICEVEKLGDYLVSMQM